MRVLLLTGGFGLLLLLGLLYYFGFNDIAEAVSAIGWGLGLIVLLRFAQIAGAGKAWSFLFPQTPEISLSACIGLRLVREGINTLLPVAQIGGEFIGARLLAHFGLTSGEAAASVIVDLFLQAMTQAVFTIAGLGALALIGNAPAIVREVALGLLAFIPGLIGFFMVQRFGGLGWAGRQIARLAKGREWHALGKMTDLNENIQRLYKDWRTTAKSASLHLTVWFLGAGEIWIALAFMGQPVTPGEALVIESLSQALRSATFVMPASLGVQEGGTIALCAVFGLPATNALAVSLAKRGAELAVGIVGLMLWQIAESRIGLRRSRKSRAGGP